MAESLAAMTERLQLSDVKAARNIENEPNFAELNHEVLGEKAREHLMKNPSVHFKDLLFVIGRELNIPAPQFTTKSHHKNSEETTIISEVVFGSWKSYARTVLNFASKEEFKHEWRNLLILSENRATRNLLTGRDTSQVKTAFESATNVVRATSAQIASPSHIRGLQNRSKAKIEKFIQKIEKGYLCLDIERSAGPFDSEVLQLAIISGRGDERKCFNRYVKPQGGVDPVAARLTHQMRLRNGNLHKNEIPLPTVSAAECLDDLFVFLREISTSLQGRALTLVSYGEADLPNITNFLDYNDRLTDFLKLVPNHCDFQTVMRMDTFVKKKTRGKIGLSNMSEDTSIVKLITGNVPSNQVHDALYDASILHQVFFTYLKNGTFYKETFSSFRENSVSKINPRDIQLSLVKMRRKRLGRGWQNPHNIYYPAGLTRY